MSKQLKRTSNSIGRALVSFRLTNALNGRKSSQKSRRDGGATADSDTASRYSEFSTRSVENAIIEEDVACSINN